MSGNQLVAKCREALENQSISKSVIDDLVLTLTHEHELRKLIFMLPEGKNLQDAYSRVLFASFFSGFIELGHIAKSSKSLASLSSATPKLDEERLTPYGKALVDLLEPLKADFDQFEKKKAPKQANQERTEYEKKRRQAFVFRERLKEFLACTPCKPHAFTKELLDYNKRVVNEWRIAQDNLPKALSEPLKVLVTELESLPFPVTDSVLEHVEMALLSSGFAHLNTQEQKRLAKLIGLLLQDEHALGNFYWLLAENAFVKEESWKEHQKFVATLDAERCFSVQSVEILSKYAEIIAKVEEDSRDPFYQLLDLKVLKRAAKVGVDALRKKA